MSQGRQVSILQVRGRKTQLSVGGSGPPLLYLHSAGGETEWTASWHEALARHFTVYAPAHPGFAESQGIEGIDHVTDCAWHYVDMLADLKLARVPVVGFSLGGWIGAQLAIFRPALVERLVLIAAAGLRLSEAPVPEYFIDDMEKLKRLVYHDPRHPSVAEVFPTSHEDSRILLWLRAREATARLAWNPYLHDPKLKAHLRRIECPTLLLWGDDDRLIPPAHGQAFAQAIPNARLEILPQCGHMAPFEKTDDCVERIRAFLKT